MHPISLAFLPNKDCPAQIKKEEKSAHLQEKKNTSQVMIGRNGRKNCRVTGMSNAVMRRVAAPVFTMGPGVSLMDKAKMPRMMRTKY